MAVGTREKIWGCGGGSNREPVGSEGVSSNNKSGLSKRRRMKMTNGPEGKLVFYTFPQLKIIIILGGVV